MKTIPIKGQDKSFGGDYTYIVAEIGKGFIQTKEGQTVSTYLKNAIDLVDAAVDSGVDAVKFQTHVLEDEVLNIDFTSPHFKGSDRYNWVKRNEAATPIKEFWVPLVEHCKKKGITFFSTPMSKYAAQMLEENFDVPFWKIGSGDVTDHVLIDYICETGKPIIISTGMVSLAELDEVIKYITGKGSPLVVLYCVSEYPCPPEHFNLSSIEALIEKYPNIVVGFSDHSIDSNDVDLAAVKLGARMIEKHFTLDRKFWGSDHKSSILPDEMKQLVRDIRDKNYEKIDVAPYCGEVDSELEGAHNQFRPYFHKALMAGADIKEGTKLAKDTIFAMRPIMHAGGLHASKLEDVLGKCVTKNIKKFDPITENILK